MCLAALAFEAHTRFPFVLAANRDEAFDRPAAGLGWWEPGEGLPAVLGGRDLQAAGTWLGLTAQGRLALLTNVRRGGNTRADTLAPSRGEIVARWLRGDAEPSRFTVDIGLAGYNGFNLLAIDFPQATRFWASSDALPQRLHKGVFGVSNAALDTPWPKVTQLKQRLQQAVRQGGTAQALAGRLFDALADRTQAADHSLPSTGITLERERQLSSAFIQTPERRYGTRCSTVVLTEVAHGGWLTHVVERSFGTEGQLEAVRQTELAGWPPKPGGAPPERSAVQVWQAADSARPSVAP
jgi:uncharacterized protein with NRDE domain